MKIICTRTSEWNAEHSPCEGAVLTQYVKRDTSRYPIPENRKAWWLSQGRNHRVEGGIQVRDIETAAWMTDIENLQDLYTFCKKYGEVILDVDDSRDAPALLLEIYDDYRE